MHARNQVVWKFTSEDAINAVPERSRFLDALREHAGAAVDESAAKIVFTELVANVVRHAPGRITITLEIDGATPVLKVQDMGPGFTLAPRLARTLHSESGRGLFLASQYAEDLWLEPRDGSGARVCAALRLNEQKTH